MPRKLFKRWSPDPAKIRNIKALNFLGALLHDPNLFHLNRHSVSVAFFVGLFCAFLPVLGQIPLAALGALFFRCNLPISVALVWISNPFTFPVIYFATYKLGVKLMQLEPKPFHFEMSWQWFATEFAAIWEPLLLGSLIASLFFGCLGFLIIQWTWRWHVIQRWQERRAQRLAQKNKD
ncbi:DUF2062 domain-containing protein [Teredinibacter turnerae]|uniref:DUF2062 domain-containing protein n=1 Tax=Teredinibacter turnerae (strain ATCC 39867 / T7901) TaxID=377629 RepID=C5BL33_TERTT|nr:DUF2062 domain-containing protein [Teredinibacter turnerae]ACR14690.1 Conserved Hypothetical protein [Teredinibacter turnerae T7901]